MTIGKLLPAKINNQKLKIYIRELFVMMDGWDRCYHWHFIKCVDIANEVIIKYDKFIC